MYRIAGLLLTTMLLVGLSQCKRNQKPEGVLSEAEMIQVLMNMYLEEERFSRITLSYDSATKLSYIFKQKAFERIGVTDSVYKKSMEYYMAHPKRLEFIYTALIDSLSLLEQSSPAIPPQYAPSN